MCNFGYKNRIFFNWLEELSVEGVRQHVKNILLISSGEGGGASSNPMMNKSGMCVREGIPYFLYGILYTIR